MVNGQMGSRKVKEYGKVFMAVPMWDSGSNPKQKAEAFTSGQQETSTKESGRTVSSMVKEQNPSVTEMSLLAGMRTAGRMERDLTSGVTEQPTWGISLMV
jgi:hypothetical protein